MKKYNYMDLIKAYQKNCRYKDVEYFKYYFEQYNAMSMSFGIFFEKEFQDWKVEV
jgi:hypothetical protein